MGNKTRHVITKAEHILIEFNTKHNGERGRKEHVERGREREGEREREEKRNILLL